jgi:flagellar hook-associated protein 1 FlgK
MVSTFNGLEMAKRALSAQQAAMYTTSHNISNANTEGYTRQRVNFEAINGLTSSREPGGIIDTIGNGVEPGSVERIREQFLDVQFRKENAKTQYYGQRAEAAKQMEAILNEPSEVGLSHIFDQFWNSLQDLSVNPEDSGARSVVAQRAQAVADTFQYTASSLESVRDDLRNEMNVKQTEFNSLLDQINQLNRQIGEIEPHGHVANDLYDERDRLLDQLSSIADISVSYEESSGMPSKVAMGKATVKLTGKYEKDGQPVDVILVDARDNKYEVNKLTIESNDNDNVEAFQFGDLEIKAGDFKVNGQLKALMEMHGYQTEDAAGNPVEEGLYIDILDQVDTMAETFVEKFNETHANGFDLAGEEGINNFFELDSTVRPSLGMSVNQEILNNKDKIAASSAPNASGDGLNAVELAGSYTEFITEASLEGDDIFVADNLAVGKYTVNKPDSFDGTEDYWIYSNINISDETLSVIDSVIVDDKTNKVIAVSGDGENFYAINDVNLTGTIDTENGDTFLDNVVRGNAQPMLTSDTEVADGNQLKIEAGELGNKTSVKSYFEGMIGELGVVAQEAYRMEANSGTLRQQVSDNRDSVSKVSLDEEMTNLIKFQHAYNAAARSMTTIDETLDRIINNMGLVGR